MTDAPFNLSRQLRLLLSDNKFFYAVLAVLGLSSLWIAVTALYPMAFDEEFHFGLIKVYATSWLPYGIEHTKDMAQYGAATSDPSYLWQYLLSFPYRVMDLIGLSERTIITALRFINIAIVLIALLVYRKVLLYANLGKAKAHVIIAFSTLIPILPMLAGQINYDNPLFLIVALSFLLSLRIRASIKNQNIVPLRDTALLVITLLIGSSIKYAFVPIALGIVLWLMVELIFSRKVLRSKKIILSLKKELRTMRPIVIVMIVIGIGLSSFFTARYAINYTTYGALIPSCPAVFDKTACQDYGPWARNQLYRESLDPNFQPLPFISYIVNYWLPDMAYRLTFAVAGPTNDYQTKTPFTGVIWGFVILTASGFIALISSLKHVFRVPFMRLVVLTSVLYAGSLMIKLYGAYSKYGVPVAINGRYLLLLLPFIGAGLMVAISHLLNRYGLRRWTPIIAAGGIALLIATGAGITTYVIQSEPTWYY